MTTDVKKSDLKRDLIILSASFTFTIIVAIFIINQTQDARVQSEVEIEKLINKIVQEKIKLNNFNERKNDQVDENSRSKRAVHESRVTTDIPIGNLIESKPEKNDSTLTTKNNWKGVTTKGDKWVWLTADSRIPFEAIEGFCKQTKEYCPPGPAGIPGLPGPRGPKGDTGYRGLPGLSIRGDRGDKGARGPKGFEGRPGKDGKDGFNGEPGLDGAPGRHGVDGKDGVNGTPGERGYKGDAGINGEKGEKGANGTNGLKGDSGLDGSRGPKGDAGENGSPGSSGTCFHSCNQKGDQMSYDNLLFSLPPRIPTSKNSSNISPVITVMEGDNVRLRCSAEGHPKPTVSWRRKDGDLFAVSGDLKVNEVHGNVLNFTKINRVHMGTYQCIANNGIGPEAVHEFPLEIHFKPLVTIDHRTEQEKMAREGRNISLVCGSEASPYPVMYWERKDSTTITSEYGKYKVEQGREEGRSETYNSTLTFFNIKKSDIDQEYFCVSKNDLGMAKVRFYLSNTGVNIAEFIDNSRVMAGTIPPPIHGMEDVCPMHVPCRECPTIKDMRCKDIISSITDLIDPNSKDNYIHTSFNGTKSYRPLVNRTTDCQLGLIGKPVFYHAIESEKFGTFLRDPVKVDNITVEKVWLTKESDKSKIFEYRNKLEYQKSTAGEPNKIIVTKHNLPCAFEGNAHVVYNNAFYYYCKDEAIVRFDLKALSNKQLPVKDIGVNTTHKLYKAKYNVIDFNADDNGLWLIHSSKNSNYTIVTKINETSLEVQNSFNVSVYHDKLGEMFIACGILYGVDSTNYGNTKIRLALDLYTKKLLDADINFSIPFNNTSTVGFNFLTKDLYTWSMGNQLTYPVKLNALGTNETEMKSVLEIVRDGGASHSVTKKIST